MDLREELETQQVTHLDLSRFCQVEAGASVRETLAAMRQAGSNVCLVMEASRLVGIFTDRDVLQRVAGMPAKLVEPVSAVMTPDPVTIAPDATAAAALRLMDEGQFRNLPVVKADGTVVGHMTYRAIINYLAARYPVEVLNRPPRPDHFPSRAEGG